MIDLAFIPGGRVVITTRASGDGLPRNFGTDRFTLA